MPGSEFQQGKREGRTENRLDDHDEHFRRINGSIETLATEVGALTMAIQRLTDQGTARDVTVVTTAAALKSANDARREASEQRWSPFAKVVAVLGVAIAAVGLLVGVWLR